MLWSKRRSSRSDLYNSKSQPEQQLSSSRRLSLSTNSSPRLPFSPLDPLNPQGSQSSLAAAIDDRSSSLISPLSDLDSSLGKQSIARQIANRDMPDPKHNQLSRTSHNPQPDQSRRNSVPSQNAAVQAPVSGQAADALNTDLYTYNSLNSFSFGSVQLQTSSSRPVHPFSAGPDDENNTSDDLFPAPDITPRPSVVAYHHLNQSQNSIRSHPAQHPEQLGWPPHSRHASPGGHRRVEIDRDRDGRDADNTSQRTSGASSASASVTSLSSTGADFLRTGSSSSHHTTSTNQTSSSDISSSDDDHHHPIPPNIVNAISPILHDSGTESSGTAVEFSSDEEYGESEYDYDYYDGDSGINIEIGSAQFEGSVLTHDWDHALYSHGSSGSGSLKGSRATEKRGSLPMAIPGAVSAEQSSGRNREDSVATLRRPSRSLDDEFRKLGLNRGEGGSGNATGNEGPLNRSLPPAPVSVPETDGDWRNLEERSKTKGKAREYDRDDPLSTSSTLGSTVSRAPPIPSTKSGNVMEEFDLDWNQMRGGIVSLDPIDLSDIIGQNNQGPSPSDRRPSALSSRWQIWGNNNVRRPSTATVSSFAGDSFGKAVGQWGGDGYQAQRRDWSFKREKADRSGVVPGGVGEGGNGGNSITGLLTPRGSMMTERNGAISVGLGDRDREPPKEEKEKVAKPGNPWKGMELDTQEVWKNDLVGRFKVDRRATKPVDPAKGPQQRLVVQHFRDPYTSLESQHNGPPVTIHKHSKAVAFSISRHHRPPRVMSNASRDASFVGSSRRRSSRGEAISTPSRATDATLAGGATVPAAKKSSSMILLAPRRVQEAYTSTNTTRKLESHGLLDDNAAGNAVESKDKESVRRQKEREKEKERQKEKERKRKPAEGSKDKGKAKARAKDDLYSTSSGGSVTSGSTLISTTSPAPPASAPSLHTYPPSSTASLNSNSIDHELTFGNRIVSRNSSRTSRRRRRPRDPLDDDEDDEDDDGHAAVTRTPHSETYGTMDASLIEQLRPRQERSHLVDYDSNAGFLKRLIRGRGTHSNQGPSSGQIESTFDPPWLTMASRNKQEQQQRVVENLNSSFKDVGLLPSTHKDKPRQSAPQKQKKIASGDGGVDIFKEIPADSLYMLLPLWPGDTDPVSERQAAVTKKFFVPSERRQYLLVYYKLPPDVAIEGESKKRLRNSPTSSNDASAKKDDRASVLLTSFHISARLVSYKDLQGSGVRVPDEGLTINGPLDVAFHTMPSAVREKGLYEWVLGMCHSREAGIEFYPDGLLKMGLCFQTSEPIPPCSEEDQPPEPDVELTPIGRAVLEMAWLGALALTSFGPGT